MRFMQYLILFSLFMFTACAHKHCDKCHHHKDAKQSCCPDKGQAHQCSAAQKCEGDSCPMQKKCCDATTCQGKCEGKEGECAKCKEGKCDGSACEMKKAEPTATPAPAKKKK